MKVRSATKSITLWDLNARFHYLLHTRLIALLEYIDIDPTRSGVTSSSFKKLYFEDVD